MKIIVAIIASDNDCYVEFKQSWIKNIYNIKKDLYLSKIFEFYFLYSDTNGISQECIDTETNQILYVNYYDNSENYDSVTHSILGRTMSFFDYTIKKFNLLDDTSYNDYKQNGLYFLRTNLSTAFDFKLLSKWVNNKPKINFFGGSFNGYYNNIFTTISGTNLLFSLDIMMYLTMNKHKIDIKNVFEDEAVSTFIIQNLNVFLINIKRLDFIEMEEIRIPRPGLPDHIWQATPNSIIYHKTKIGDEDIFTFRFKTFNRDNDIKIIRYVVEDLWTPDYCLSNLVKKVSKLFKPELPISEEAPTYGELYSKTPFKILNLTDIYQESLTIQLKNE